MSAPARLESVEQSLVVEWFHAQHKPLRGLLFASANGLHIAGTPRQRAAKWASFVRQGGRKGVADLFLAVPSHGFHGLWIEMKSLSGRASQDQLDFIDDMLAQGYAAVVCRGFDAARQAITDYLGGNGEGRQWQSEIDP